VLLRHTQPVFHPETASERLGLQHLPLCLAACSAISVACSPALAGRCDSSWCWRDGKLEISIGLVVRRCLRDRLGQPERGLAALVSDVGGRA